MASFVEEATLRIDNKASSEIRALNKDILNLLRNARKLNKLKIDFGADIKRSQRQISGLAKSLNALPKSRTISINVNQNGAVPRVPRAAPPPPAAPNAPSPPGGGGGRSNSPWRDGTFAGVVRIATAYATFTGAVNIARASVTATNESQAQTTRELSIFRGDKATQDAIARAARDAVLSTRRLDETRTRGIATDLVLGGVTNQNLPAFTTLFSNTESAIGALFPGLEKSVTLFNNKMVNLANASDDIDRSAKLVRGGAQGIAAAGESFNAATSIAALRGSGLAPTINEKGLANFILLTDAMGQNIASGVTRLRKELFTPTEQAGAGSGISKGAVANLNERNLRNYTNEQRALFSQDPAKFIEDVLAPRIRANNVDTTDREALQRFIESAGFNATSQRLILSTLSSIEERAQQLRNVSGLDPSNPNVGTEGNLALATNDLIKAFNTLSAHTLTPLFEATAPYVQGFADFVEKTALSASKLDDVALAAGTLATTFGLFAAGKGIANSILNPLNGSALALDGSAAALTRAAVALGGEGVAGGAADAAGGRGRRRSGFSKAAGAAAGATVVLPAAVAAIDAAKETLLASKPGLAKEMTPEANSARIAERRESIDGFFAKLRSYFPASAAPPTEREKLNANLQTAQDNLSFAKQAGDINLIPQLQTELQSAQTAISMFDQTFQTGADKAGMTISTGLEAGANLLTGGLATAFVAGADVIAQRITAAINSAVINVPRVAAAPQPNTGATTPTE
jgi:hypothetical protein